MTKKATPQQLTEMSTLDLVLYYNEISGCPPIKKFSDRATALRRVQQAIDAAKVVEKPEEEIAKKTADPTRFDLPAKDVIKPHRPTGDRGTAIAMLLKGCTLEELVAATSWGVKRTPNRILAIHRDQGYGVQETDKGVITIFTK